VKRRRHAPEQLVRKLREADRPPAERIALPEVAKALGVSEQTYHRWRVQFGGMKADDVREIVGTLSVRQPHVRLPRLSTIVPLPDSCEINGSRLLPTTAGSTCSKVCESARTPAACMPALCAKACLPTYGWSGSTCG
jgi:hypothetical protein